MSKRTKWIFLALLLIGIALLLGYCYFYKESSPLESPRRSMSRAVLQGTESEQEQDLKQLIQTQQITYALSSVVKEHKAIKRREARARKGREGNWSRSAEYQKKRAGLLLSESIKKKVDADERVQRLLQLLPSDSFAERVMTTLLLGNSFLSLKEQREIRDQLRPLVANSPELYLGILKKSIESLSDFDMVTGRASCLTFAFPLSAPNKQFNERLNDEIHQLALAELLNPANQSAIENSPRPDLQLETDEIAALKSDFSIFMASATEKNEDDSKLADNVLQIAARYDDLELKRYFLQMLISLRPETRNAVKQALASGDERLYKAVYSP